MKATETKLEDFEGKNKDVRMVYSYELLFRPFHGFFQLQHKKFSLLICHDKW